MKAREQARAAAIAAAATKAARRRTGTDRSRSLPR